MAYKKAAKKPANRLSLFIDDDLITRARVQAARLNIPVYQLVAEALKQYLSKKKDPV